MQTAEKVRQIAYKVDCTIIDVHNKRGFMGFNDVKKQVISCIREGSYDHEVRKNLDVKNLFQCG
ncbi:hypothetical protein D5018_20975 [Parashewanella curva]|uniref:Uncharacterized protein n=1 Tax=Parashewanella curva TaxID=2338552 RepID=A0A3L8PTK3_9GAMM|nr:hypothetical protein D5018_20975 [Parashewanella curva]